MHPFITYRQRNGLSQAALAEILGISDAMVSHIETGKRPITAESAIDYESKLGGAVTRQEMRPDIFGPPPLPSPIPLPTSPLKGEELDGTSPLKPVLSAVEGGEGPCTGEGSDEEDPPARSDLRDPRSDKREACA